MAIDRDGGCGKGNAKRRRKYSPRTMDRTGPGEYEGTITNGENTLRVRVKWSRGKPVVDALDQNSGQNDGTKIDNSEET